MSKKNIFGALFLLFTAGTLSQVLAMDHKNPKQNKQELIQNINEKYEEEVQKIRDREQEFMGYGIKEEMLEQETKQALETAAWQRRAKLKLLENPNSDLSKI